MKYIFLCGFYVVKSDPFEMIICSKKLYCYSPIEELDIYEWENLEEDFSYDHGGNLKNYKSQFYMKRNLLLNIKSLQQMNRNRFNLHGFQTLYPMSGLAY